MSLDSFNHKKDEEMRESYENYIERYARTMQ